MPLPPTITTSLAERIAKLNSSRPSIQSSSHEGTLAPNHSFSNPGQIRLKISRYEASGANEAPLIPKGSFGLGVPLPKPQRGLDRMRIASLGVSGGEQPPKMLLSSLAPPNPASPTSSLGHPLPDGSNLGVGCKRISCQALCSDEQSGLPAPDKLQAVSLPNGDQAGNNHLSASSAEPSEDAPYAGILDGYPTTPEEDDALGVPLVSCADCSELVPLELLAEHLCSSITKPGIVVGDVPDLGHVLLARDAGGIGPLSPVDVPVDAREEDEAVECHEDPDGLGAPIPQLVDSAPGPFASIPSAEPAQAPTPRPTRSQQALQVPSDQVCSNPPTRSPSDITLSLGASSSLDQVTSLCPTNSSRDAPSTHTRLSELQPAANRLSSSSSSSASTTTSTSSTSQSTKASSLPLNDAHSSPSANLGTGHKQLTRSSNLALKTRSSWYDDENDEYVENTGYVTIVRTNMRL